MVSSLILVRIVILTFSTLILMEIIDRVVLINLLLIRRILLLLLPIFSLFALSAIIFNPPKIVLDEFSRFEIGLLISAFAIAFTYFFPSFKSEEESEGGKYQISVFIFFSAILLGYLITSDWIVVALIIALPPSLKSIKELTA